MKRIILSIAAAFLLLPLSAQRSEVTINEGWQFCRADSPQDTVNVDIPHTWNAIDCTDDQPGYWRGQGTYRKHVVLREVNRGQLYLHFEGVNQTADVKVNGSMAGTHIGGYTGFSFDITPYVVEGDNLIEVVVDNGYNPDISPLSADFTFFGGIYRDVSIIRTPRSHFSTMHYATQGVYVTVPQVDHERATLRIDAHLALEADRKAAYRLTHVVFDPEGREVKRVSANVKAAQPGTDQVSTLQLELLQPALWSIEQPQLYRIVSTLSDRQGQFIDEVVTCTGLRWFSFDSTQGFSLNGKHVKLIGTSRHQDYRLRGNALTDEVHVEDVMNLKRMGGNFLRISHYPQDPIVTQLCDRLGIVTSVEIPVINACTDSEAFRANNLNMLHEMIWQDYNSPSVCIWAFMNEILLRPPFDSRSQPDQYRAYTDVVRSQCQELNDECHRLDPYRSTMLPCHSSLKAYDEAGLTAIPDIIGWNFYTGWYGGNISEFAGVPDMLHSRYPNKSLIISEYGADMDIRQHSFQPARFDFTCEYGLSFHRGYLPALLACDAIAAAAVWNLNDFYSEGRSDGEPRVNNKGLMSLDREAKDVYHYYRAMLSSQPMVIIGGRSWQHRGGVEGQSQPLPVFSNAPEVELCINGVSLGSRKVDNGCAMFDVPFSHGDNQLTARATDGSATDQLNISFTAYPGTIGRDFHELNVLCGTNIYYDDRISHLAWIPEQAYTPGSWGYVGGETMQPKTRRGNVPRCDIDFIGTANDGLFQSQRRGLESFRADVPDGQYYVYLYFAEWTTSAGKEEAAYLLGGSVMAEQATERSFDVNINGTRQLTDFNPAREVGTQRAIVKRFTVTATGGQGLRIDFTPRQGETILNAVRILRAF